MLCDNSPRACICLVLQDVDDACVVNSASATAEYLAEQLKADGQAFDTAPVYALGGPGVREELSNLGINFRGKQLL